jgi:hypothetical protein
VYHWCGEPHPVCCVTHQFPGEQQSLGGDRVTPVDSGWPHIPAWTVTQVCLAPEILKLHESEHPEWPGSSPRLVSARLLGLFSFPSQQEALLWLDGLVSCC